MLNYIRALIPNDVKGEILEGIGIKFRWKNSVKPSKISYWKMYGAKIIFRKVALNS